MKIEPGHVRNPVDRVVARNLHRFKVLRTSDEKGDFWVPVIEKVLLSLSDQQLTTGIAILFSGLIQHCSISVYHFGIVSDLAWSSSYVHLTSLSVLQDIYVVGHNSGIGELALC